MNIAAYIETGILEQYCLGLLPEEERREVAALRREHPAIAMELAAIEAALEQYAAVQAVPPPPGLQEKIWDTLDNLNREKEIDWAHLPLINRFTDHKNWLRLVRRLIPERLEEDRVIHVLQQSDKVIQMLVLSKTDFDNEVHRDEYESFIILEGECECNVGGHIFRLQPGGFTEIPLHTDHDVRITSGHVVAILQRIAV